MINDYTHLYYDSKRQSEIYGALGTNLEEKYNAKSVLTDSNVVFIPIGETDGIVSANGLIFGEAEYPGPSEFKSIAPFHHIVENDLLALTVIDNHYAPSGKIVYPIAINIASTDIVTGTSGEVTTNNNIKNTFQYADAHINDCCLGDIIAGYYNESLDGITGYTIGPGSSYQYAIFGGTKQYGVDLRLFLSVVRAFNSLDFSKFHGEAYRIVKAWLHIMEYGWHYEDDPNKIMFKSPYNEYGEPVRKRVLIRNQYFPSNENEKGGAIFGESTDKEWSMTGDDYSKLAVLDIVMTLYGSGSKTIIPLKENVPVTESKHILGFNDFYGVESKDFFDTILQVENRLGVI
jgi:hypothetical protein